MSALGDERDTLPPPAEVDDEPTRDLQCAAYVLGAADQAARDVLIAHERQGQLAATAAAALHIEAAWRDGAKHEIDLRTAVGAMREMLDSVLGKVRSLEATITAQHDEIVGLRADLAGVNRRVVELEDELERERARGGET